MQLNIAEKKEIQDIINNFSDKDKELIRAATDYLSKTYSPLIDAVCNHLSDEHTKDAVNYLDMDDVSFQDYAAEVFWTLMEFRASREYAISVFKRRHIYGDVT